MSNSNPFDFSEYGMNQGQSGPPGNDPFGSADRGGAAPSGPPAAPRPGGPGPGASDPFATPAAPPPSAPGPATSDPFATGSGPDRFGAGGDPFAAPAPGTMQFAGVAPANGGLAVAAPPFPLLLIALVLAIAAGVVALLLDHVVVAFICWVIAGPIAIGLVALFVRKDTYARSGGLYAAPGFVRPLYWIAVIGCLLAIWAPAWRIADWVGHL